MKMKYEVPELDVQKFLANEFCVACASGTKYLFECNAGIGYPSLGDDDDDDDDDDEDPAGLGKVYLETNGKPGLQKDGRNHDKYLSRYYPCGEKHEADTTDEFLKGYYISDYSGKVEDVIVWRGRDGDNTHCTTQLDQSSWEMNRS